MTGADPQDPKLGDAPARPVGSPQPSVAGQASAPAQFLAPKEFWSRISAALGQIDEVARTPPSDAKTAAVLMLFEETADGFSVVLTRRRRDMRSHPGQISFPGGRLEADETVEQAALREANEEVELHPGSVKLVGVGSTFFLPPSGFWVVPVVADWQNPHALRANPDEVDEVLHVPLRQLLEPARWRYTPLSERQAGWAWQLERDLLWGATAIMLEWLLDTVAEPWRHEVSSPEQLGTDRQVRPWDKPGRR